MSGELRLANSGMAPLATSLAALAEAVPIGEFAVIGGLAVLARLQGAHRVTYDLDTVATQHGDELTSVETVISTEGVDGLLLGTKIDCIAVGDVPATDIPPDLLPEGEADRIFVLAHRLGPRHCRGPHAHRRRRWRVGGRGSVPNRCASKPRGHEAPVRSETTCGASGESWRGLPRPVPTDLAPRYDPSDC